MSSFYVDVSNVDVSMPPGTALRMLIVYLHPIAADVPETALSVPVPLPCPFITTIQLRAVLEPCVHPSELLKTLVGINVPTKEQTNLNI